MAYNTYKKEVKNTASDLKAKIKSNPSGAYFFFGDEEYLKEARDLLSEIYSSDTPDGKI